MKTALAAGCFALALLAALPGAASAATAWSPCMYTVMQLDCATYDFPLDRTGVAGGITKVRAIRMAATEGPRMGTMFVIAGGPGQASQAMLEFASLFAGANRYDLIAIDQRGTGLSEPLDCPRIELGDFRFDGGDPKTDKPITNCATALGVARGGYDTVESIADMEAIRADLGIDQITLFGVSYGTKVALAYAGLHPNNVKALMIDSVLPVDQPGQFDTVSIDAMRKSLSDDVCGAGRCKGVVSSPVGKLAKLAARLEASPVDSYTVDESGKITTAKIDAEALYQVVFAADFNLYLYNQLPMMIDAALRGNDAPLQRLYAIANGLAGASAKQRKARGFRGYVPSKRRRSGDRPVAGKRYVGEEVIDVAFFSNTLNLTTSCEDFAAPWSRGAPLAGRQDAIDAAANAIPDSTFYPFSRKTARNSSLSAICRGYSESADTPVMPTGPMPQVPTLALNGSLDVRTPVSWAQQAIAGNPFATLAVIPHTGHSTIGTDVSGCALSLAKRFLIYGGVDGKCTSSPPPVPVAARAASTTKSVKPLPGSCSRLRGAKCTSAKKTVTAGYDAMRDAINQLVIGGMEEGPGVYSGGWYIEFELSEEDLFSEVPAEVVVEMKSDIPGVVANGKIDISSYPSISGDFTVLDFGSSPFDGAEWDVEISGSLAYDPRDDRVTLDANSGRKRVNLRRRSPSASAVRVTRKDLQARSSYARATMARRGLR